MSDFITGVPGAKFSSDRSTIRIAPVGKVAALAPVAGGADASGEVPYRPVRIQPAPLASGGVAITYSSLRPACVMRFEPRTLSLQAAAAPGIAAATGTDLPIHRAPDQSDLASRALDALVRGTSKLSSDPNSDKPEPKRAAPAEANGGPS